MLSITEENYLKALFKLTSSSLEKSNAGTNEMATHLNVKPATVNDMLKKLKEKNLINYEKYKKITFTPEGKKLALEVLRKHRLWETFLYEKLQFSWDEVHEVAEQLEHIQSERLVNKLDEFLGFPTEDPHGDAIPDIHGNMKTIEKQLLSDGIISQKYICVGVKDTSSEFLKYLDKQEIALGSKIEFLSKESFDLSVKIKIDNSSSEEELKNIYSTYPQFAKEIYPLIVSKQSALTALNAQMISEKSVIRMF